MLIGNPSHSLSGEWIEVIKTATNSLMCFMELSKQVCSLELAERLKGLEVGQKSLFYWVNSSYWWGSGNEKLFLKGHKFQTEFVVGENGVGISAFTVAELGEMLTNTNYNWQNAKYDHEARKGRWFIVDFTQKLPVQEADTEADVRALMLIYLIENKLITSPTL